MFGDQPYYPVIIFCTTYFLWTIIHDTLYPMRKKSDISILFPQFNKLDEIFFQLPIICIYSDNGSEYEDLASILNSYGISHLPVLPHTPEHNGTSPSSYRRDRQNSHANCLSSSLILVLCLQTATFLINRFPNAVLNFKSSFEMLFHRTPNYNHLNFFWLPMLPMASSIHFLQITTSLSPMYLSRLLYHSIYIQMPWSYYT